MQKDFEEELFFRKIVEDETLITESQLEECLEIQRNNPKASSLFVIMIEKGYINHKNMGVILKEVPPQMQQQTALIAHKKSHKKFGELCVEKGFASIAQVAECLKIQERLKREGKHIRLGQILHEKNYLVLHQAQIILEAQGKKILRCGACETKYNIKHYKPNKAYQCPKCGGSLISYELNRSASVGVAQSFMDREAVEVDDESLALLNRKIGDYKIVELLGEGGMASVYKVVSQFRRRPRALKVMKSQAGLERFTREFESASALRHPNIIRVYERGVFEGRPYFFMEYIDGGTLARRIEKMGIIPLLEGLYSLKQVAMGLKYAHENNIVHRDIKTSNIMLSRDSNKITAKVTDFGIARAASDSRITMTGQLVGTFKYMAPEYIKGVGIEGKSDIFSLGIVAYEMFTGQEPFEVDAPVGYLFVNIKETAPPIHQMNPDLPKALTTLVNYMMAKDVRKRYDAAALLRDLDRLIRHFQDGEPLHLTEDKTSAFYSRSKLYSLKEIWQRLSQKFSGDSTDDEIPIEIEETQRRPVPSEALSRMAETEEVPKEMTAQKQYEFATDLLKKGNIDAAKKNLQAIVEVFPGTPWAPRARKKLATLDGKTAPKDRRTVKKKHPLKRYIDEQSLEKTQIKLSPPHSKTLTSQSRKKSAGKISTDSSPMNSFEKKRESEKDRFEALAPVEKGLHISETLSLGRPTSALEKRNMVNKAQDLLVSVKAFIDNVRNFQEYEQKKPWLDDVFSHMLEVPWDHAKEEVSEILYKWGRFLLDNGKYGEGLVMFWELYERFPETRWHSQVFEELVALEQPENMVFLEGGAYSLNETEMQVDIAPFFIDAYPVTNAKYLEFVRETGHPAPVHWMGDMYPVGKANHPVVWVSAEDSMEYAHFRSRRLPIEEEWEKAARGPDGKLWPWGNRYETRKCNCRESGAGDTSPVGAYESGVSFCRCYDLAGNVWEWTNSWYDREKKKQKVLRGGSWFTYEKFTTSNYRNFDYPAAKSGLYGFRCAKNFDRPEKLQG